MNRACSSSVIVAPAAVPTATGTVAVYQNIDSREFSFTSNNGNTSGLCSIVLPSDTRIGDTYLLQVQGQFLNLPDTLYGFMGMALYYDDAVLSPIQSWCYAPSRLLSGGDETGPIWDSNVLPIAGKLSGTLVFTVLDPSQANCMVQLSNTTNTLFTDTDVRFQILSGNVQLVRIARGAGGDDTLVRGLT